MTGVDVQQPSGNPLKSSTAAPFVANLGYTALGQPRAWTWASGDSASRSFDTDGRMTASEFASYSYDAASRITSVTQKLWARTNSGKDEENRAGSAPYPVPITWTAGYDSRNRLTSFARSGASSSYSYDPNSNRLTAIDTVTSDADLDGLFDADGFSQSASQRINQSLNIDAASNKLLGFSQSVTQLKGSKSSTASSQIRYTLDANGAMTGDGLRTFDYDAARRLAKVNILQDGEAASISYLHNALGQRVFKSEAQSEQRQPDERTLGVGFVDWLKKNFQWMFATGQSSASASVGTAFVYDEDANLLGEYDNGSAKGKGRQEYIWLPTDDGQAIPIGIYRNGRMFAVHADHLGTPRVITDDGNEPVWQWPYSAFGNNKPSGVLKASQNPKAGVTNQAVLLKATEAGIEANLRFPGQYFDEESNLSYNYFRSYQSAQGRYTQADPIGLGGGLNRFTYVGEDPFSYYDSRGLDKITWGSKSGPLYGKWGGRDWSGGQRPSEHGGEMGSERPVDSLDFCAQQHDRCWDKADGSNLQCVADAASSEKKDYCDARFSACARRLGDDPNRWLVPPTPGTEIDASRYRRGAIFLGDHNFYRH